MLEDIASDDDYDPAYSTEKGYMGKHPKYPIEVESSAN